MSSRSDLFPLADPSTSSASISSSGIDSDSQTTVVGSLLHQSKGVTVREKHEKFDEMASGSLHAEGSVQEPSLPPDTVHNQVPVSPCDMKDSANIPSSNHNNVGELNHPTTADAVEVSVENNFLLLNDVDKQSSQPPTPLFEMNDVVVKSSSDDKLEGFVKGSLSDNLQGFADKFISNPDNLKELIKTPNSIPNNMEDIVGETPSFSNDVDGLVAEPSLQNDSKALYNRLLLLPDNVKCLVQEVSSSPELKNIGEACGDSVLVPKKNIPESNSLSVHPVTSTGEDNLAPSKLNMTSSVTTPVASSRLSYLSISDPCLNFNQNLPSVSSENLTSPSLLGSTLVAPNKSAPCVLQTFENYVHDSKLSEANHQNESDKLGSNDPAFQTCKSVGVEATKSRNKHNNISILTDSTDSYYISCDDCNSVIESFDLSTSFVDVVPQARSTPRSEASKVDQNEASKDQSTIITTDDKLSSLSNGLILEINDLAKETTSDPLILEGKLPTEIHISISDLVSRLSHVEDVITNEVYPPIIPEKMNELTSKPVLEALDSDLEVAMKIQNIAVDKGYDDGIKTEKEAATIEEPKNSPLNDSEQRRTESKNKDMSVIEVNVEGLIENQFSDSRMLEFDGILNSISIEKDDSIHSEMDAKVEKQIHSKTTLVGEVLEKRSSNEDSNNITEIESTDKSVSSDFKNEILQDERRNKKVNDFEDNNENIQPDRDIKMIQKITPPNEVDLEGYGLHETEINSGMRPDGNESEQRVNDSLPKSTILDIHSEQHMVEQVFERSQDDCGEVYMVVKEASASLQDECDDVHMGVKKVSVIPKDVCSEVHIGVEETSASLQDDCDNVYMGVKKVIVSPKDVCSEVHMRVEETSTSPQAECHDVHMAVKKVSVSPKNVCSEVHMGVKKASAGLQEESNEAHMGEKEVSSSPQEEVVEIHIGMRKVHETQQTEPSEDTMDPENKTIVASSELQNCKEDLTSVFNDAEKSESDFQNSNDIETIKEIANEDEVHATSVEELDQVVTASLSEQEQQTGFSVSKTPEEAARDISSDCVDNQAMDTLTLVTGPFSSMIHHSSGDISPGSKSNPSGSPTHLSHIFKPSHTLPRCKMSREERRKSQKLRFCEEVNYFTVTMAGEMNEDDQQTASAILEEEDESSEGEDHALCHADKRHSNEDDIPNEDPEKLRWCPQCVLL